MTDNRFPVVVIGGGLAGFMAAIHLAKRDLPVLLLEADTEWAGGRIAGGDPETFDHQGQTWSFNSQHGIHAVWGGYDNMRAVLKEFLPDLTLRPSTGEEWINRWGTETRAVEAGNSIRSTWIPAPLHYLQLLLLPKFWRTITPLDFLSLPGFIISLMWATGLDPIEEKVRLDGLGYQEFFRGWTPNLRATFVGLAHSLLAAPSSKISLTSFIAAMRFYTMLRRDTWRLDYFPSNPNESLIHPMIDFIEAREGKVLFGARAKALLKNGDGWDIQFEDATHHITRTLSAEQVILAVHPSSAEKILTTSAATAAEARKITFPPSLRNANIRLWFDTVPRDGAMGGMFTGDFLVDNFFWLHRMQDEFIEWHQQTGGSAIEVHLYADDSIIMKRDELLIIEATKEVQAAFPELRGHFIHGTVRRNSATQTQFMIPLDEDSLHVNTPWEKLYACGDWIGYPTPALWMERCTITGIAAANAVLANQQDPQPPYAILPPRPPEALARFLGMVVKLGRKTIGRLIFGIAKAVRG